MFNFWKTKPEFFRHLGVKLGKCSILEDDFSRKGGGEMEWGEGYMVEEMRSKAVHDNRLYLHLQIYL